MWSLAWPWMLAALPLPLIVRKLVPAMTGSVDAGLKVPSLAGFALLNERSEVEQLLNWRFWLIVIAWILLVLASARPERIGEDASGADGERRSDDLCNAACRGRDLPAGQS